MVNTAAPIFSILITTHNRLDALKLTLEKSAAILSDPRVECIICDDASTDGTSVYIKSEYPEIKLISNQKNKGYIFNRNLLLASTSALYAISLDDDAYFLSENVLNQIEVYFKENESVGLIACRILWSKNDPETKTDFNENLQVQGYVGCGHIWRMKAWESIESYPEWFVFYGEEQFGAYQLFKQEWEIHYVSSLFVKHCVDLKGRQLDKDYGIRMRRSLRAGWYLMFLYYPLSVIPRRFLYSLWIQLKTKVFNGNLKALQAIALAFFDLVGHMVYFRGKRRLTNEEFITFESFPKTRIYLQPDKE
jgi:glycosyltransferase involved in cell wall biosynthesis